MGQLLFAWSGGRGAGGLRARQYQRPLRGGLPVERPGQAPRGQPGRQEQYSQDHIPQRPWTGIWRQCRGEEGEGRIKDQCWSQIGVGTNDTKKQIVYAKRSNAGIWGGSILITDAPYDRFAPSLVIDDFDNVYIAYYGEYLDPNNSCENIACKKYDGTNWKSVTLLTEESTSFNNPCLSKTNSGFDAYVHTTDGGSYNKLYGIYTGWDFPTTQSININLKSIINKINKEINLLNILCNIKNISTRIERYLHGRNAFIKVDGNKIRNLSEWTLNNKSKLIDSTAFDDRWFERKLINKDWSAVLSGFFDPDDTTGQKVLEDAYLNKTKITNIKFYMRLNLYYAPDTATDCNAGCYITAIETSREASGVVFVAINVEGTGSFKRVDL